jgi:hypothetical protein
VMNHSNPEVNTGVVTGVMNNLRSIVPGGMDQVDVRLMKIESLMKQKASGRHYIMLAFYVLSLVAMKLDDKYSIFNFLFPQKDNIEMVSAKTNRNLQMQQKRMAANAPVQKLQPQPQPKKKATTRYY